VLCAFHLGKYTVPDAMEVSEKNMKVWTEMFFTSATGTELNSTH